MEDSTLLPLDQDGDCVDLRRKKLGFPSEPLDSSLPVINGSPSPSPTHRHLPSSTLALGLVDPASHKSISSLHGKVFVRDAERFGSMGTLDIMREAVTIIRANSSILMPTMLILICPVSLLLLSRALLHEAAYSRFTVSISSTVSSMGLLHYLSLVRTLYESLCQALVSYALAAPVLFTIGLLAKASIIYIVSSTYSDKLPSFVASIAAGIRSWKRIFLTYLWSFLVILSFGLLAVVVFLVSVSLLHAMHFTADLIFLTELALGIFYSVVFAQIIVIGNLANTICILEESNGFSALVRSFHLIKGKIQVALSLFVISAAIMSIVENLYQYRVIGIPPSNYVITTGSRMWEGPLLVFMYSFLLLWDVVIGCIFYFVCKSDSIRNSSKEAELVDI